MKLRISGLELEWERDDGTSVQIVSETLEMFVRAAGVTTTRTATPALPPPVASKPIAEHPWRKAKGKPGKPRKNAAIRSETSDPRPTTKPTFMCSGCGETRDGFERIPRTPCPKCGGSAYERVAGKQPVSVID